MGKVLGEKFCIKYTARSPGRGKSSTEQARANSHGNTRSQSCSCRSLTCSPASSVLVNERLVTGHLRTRLEGRVWRKPHRLEGPGRLLSGRAPAPGPWLYLGLNTVRGQSRWRPSSPSVTLTELLAISPAVLLVSKTIRAPTGGGRSWYQGEASRVPTGHSFH